MSKLNIRHIELKEANAFVALYHRHHKAVAGHRFSLGCFLAGELVGVAIVGRAVSRHIDKDNDTVEVLRLCVKCRDFSFCAFNPKDCIACSSFSGYRNACSILYGACRRAALALGYSRIITYILEAESGASLKASGWEYCYTNRGGEWSRKNRPRNPSDNPCKKKLYHSILIK